MKKRKNKKRLSVEVLKAKAGAAGRLLGFKGRARTFTNRKKEASRKACRGDE